MGGELLGRDSCLSAGTHTLHHLAIYSSFLRWSFRAEEVLPVRAAAFALLSFSLFCFPASRQIGADRGEVMEEQSVNITSRVVGYA